jgi:hypothetical protein
MFPYSYNKDMADTTNCGIHSEKIAVMSAIVHEVNSNLDAAFKRIDELKAEVVTLRITFAEVEGDVKRAKLDIKDMIKCQQELKAITDQNKGKLIKIFAVISAFVCAIGLGMTAWKLFNP